MESASPKAREPRWFMPAVAGISLLAFVLRFAFIWRESLWNDELSTLVFTNGGPVEAVKRAASDTGPPLYYILQSILNMVVSPSEWSMRIIPALAGVGAVVAIAYVGKRLYGPLVGVIAAAMSAVSYLLILFSQEGRSYSLSVLMSVLVALTLLRALDRGRPIDFVLHGAAILGAAYTHLFGLIAAAGIIVGVMIRPRLDKRLGWKWFATLGASVVLWIPWGLVLVGQARKVASRSGAGQWVLKPPASVLGSFGDTIASYVPWGGANSMVFLSFGGLMLVGAFLAADWASKEPVGDVDAPFGLDHGDRTSLVVGWMAMVILGGLLVSKFVMPIFDWRMAVMAAPAMYLLASYGLTRVWRPAAILIVVAILAYAAIGMPRYYLKAQKEQWREATQFLLERNAKADGVVAYTSFVMKDLNMYAKILGVPEGMDGLKLTRAEKATMLLERVEDFPEAKDGSFWLVESHAPFARKDLTGLDVILRENGWKASEQKTLNKIIIRKYVKGASQNGTSTP